MSTETGCAQRTEIGAVLSARAVRDELDRAEMALCAALSARNELVRALSAQGMTVRAVGQVMGISHSRVAVILRG